MYKVVYGCCAMGFKDVALFHTYEECVKYLSTHRELIDMDGDAHYTDSLDIMDTTSGHLMSWVLR